MHQLPMREIPKDLKNSNTNLQVIHKTHMNHQTTKKVVSKM